jgi:hypothetical protein
MFVTENVPALFKKGTLKLVPSDEGGVRRVAEATCLIEPFPVGYARELGEEIANHLFTDDGAIRDELEAVDLRVRVGLQSVTVRPHEDLAPVAILSPVSIKDVSAKRIEHKESGRAWLQFSFVLVFSLEDKEARNFVLDQFGKGLLWSFLGMQRELLNKAQLHDSLAALGSVGDGTVSMGIAGGEMHEIDGEAHKAEAKRLRKQAGTH